MAEYTPDQNRRIVDDSERLRRIGERAYARFEARGGEHGRDLEDWLEAEREEAAAGPDESLDPAWSIDAEEGAHDGEVRQNRSEEGRVSPPRTTTRRTEERTLR